jgi:hypothetical protein
MERRTFISIALKSGGLCLVSLPISQSFALENAAIASSHQYSKKLKEGVLVVNNFVEYGENQKTWDSIAKIFSFYGGDELDSNNLINAYNNKTEISKEDVTAIVETFRANRDRDSLIDSLKISGSVVGLTVGFASLFVPVAWPITTALLATGGATLVHDISEKSDVNLSNTSKFQLLNTFNQHIINIEDSSFATLIQHKDSLYKFELDTEISDGMIEDSVAREIIEAIEQKPENADELIIEQLKKTELATIQLGAKVDRLIVIINTQQEEINKRKLKQELIEAMKQDESQIRAGLNVFVLLGKEFGVFDVQQANRISLTTNAMVDIAMSTTLYRLDKMSGIELTNVYLAAFSIFMSILDNSPSPEQVMHNQVMETLKKIGEMLVDMHLDLSQRLESIEQLQLKTLTLLSEMYKDFTDFKIEALSKFEDNLKQIMQVRVDVGIDQRDLHEKVLSTSIIEMNLKLSDSELRAAEVLWRQDYLSLIGKFVEHGTNTSASRAFNGEIKDFDYDVFYEEAVIRDKIELMPQALLQLYANCNLDIIKTDFKNIKMCNPREWARGADLILQSQMTTEQFYNNPSIKSYLKRFEKQGKNLKLLFNELGSLAVITSAKKQLEAYIPQILSDLQNQINVHEKSLGVDLNTRLSHKHFKAINAKTYNTLTNVEKETYDSYLYQSGKDAWYQKREDTPLDIAIKLGIIRKKVKPISPVFFTDREIEFNFIKGVFSGLTLTCSRFNTKPIIEGGKNRNYIFYSKHTNYHKAYLKYLTDEQKLHFNNYVSSQYKNMNTEQPNIIRSHDLVCYAIEMTLMDAKHRILNRIRFTSLLDAYNRVALPFITFVKVNIFMQRNDDSNYYLFMQDSAFSKNGLTLAISSEILGFNFKENKPVALSKHIDNVVFNPLIKQMNELTTTCQDLQVHNKTLPIIDETYHKIQVYLSYLE